MEVMSGLRMAQKVTTPCLVLLGLHLVHARWLAGNDNYQTVDLSPSADDLVDIHAFGKRFQLDLDDGNRRSSPPVPMYLTSSSEWRVNDQPVQIYQDGDSLVAVSRRDSMLGIDGIVKRDGDEILVESEPWGDQYGLTGGRHMVSKTRSSHQLSPLQNDYAQLLHMAEDLQVEKRGSRSGGRKQDPATVELLILVDNSVYRSFLAKHGRSDVLQQIEKHYTVLAHMVDLRYTTLEDIGLYIQVKLAGIYVAERREDSRWTEGLLKSSVHDAATHVVDPNAVLQSVRQLLMKEAVTLPQYDHAMAFTSYDLENSNGGKSAGMAFVATICRLKDAYSCSIIEEKGGLANVGTAVHELGHGLGARHDGEDGNKRCSSDDNHIMSPSNSGLGDVLRNAYTFSTCSARQIKKKISSASGECLYRTNRLAQNVDKLEVESMLPIMDRDWQCQEVYGPNSGECTMTGIQGPEDVCIRLWCMNPEMKGTCANKAGMAAMYGSSCGHNKVCQFGHCVSEGYQSTGNEAESPVYQDEEGDMNQQDNRMGDIHASSVLDVPKNCQDMDAWYCESYIRTNYIQACGSQSIAEYCCRTCSATTME